MSTIIPGASVWIVREIGVFPDAHRTPNTIQMVCDRAYTDYLCRVHGIRRGAVLKVESVNGSWITVKDAHDRLVDLPIACVALFTPPK